MPLDLPGPNAAQIALTLLSLILAAVAIVKILIPIWLWFGKVGRRITGALDNLGGREAFVDPATGKQVEAIPPIGERLTSIDTRLDALLDVNARLDNHESRLGEHDSAIAAILANTYDAAADKQLRAQELKSKGVIEGEVEEP